MRAACVQTCHTSPGSERQSVYPSNAAANTNRNRVAAPSEAARGVGVPASGARLPGGRGPRIENDRFTGQLGLFPDDATDRASRGRLAAEISRTARLVSSR